MGRTTVARRCATPLAVSLVALMLLGSLCPAAPHLTAPNFAGFFDLGNCDTIAGWAADLNNLNTPIHISVYDGPTLLTTVLANISRPDVGTAIGDNGLHGFNIAAPPILKNGLTHSVEIRFESTATNLSLSPRSIVCPTTPRDNVGTGVTLSADLKINNGAASTKSRLVGLNFTATEHTGATSSDVTAAVTHYRTRETTDSKPVNLFPGSHAKDLSSQPWIPLEHGLISELAVHSGDGKRYGERRILFQVKTATLTADVVSDTILLEPVLKEYRVSASGNDHPLTQYASSQGFGFFLNYYETCKGDCVNSTFADADLSSGSAAVAVQGLSQGGGEGRHDANPVVCVLVSVVTLGLASPLVCNTPDSAAGPAGTCTTKADYLLFTGRSPNQFWRIKSADVSNAYVVSHGANRLLAKFVFANKGATCLPPSLISVGDVVVEGPEVDDFIDPANPWKNAFVRQP